MKENKSRNLLVISVLFIVVSIIVFPKNSLSAAKAGINLWLFTVFPALLPFFIGSELLLQLGFVKNIGKFLEPIMRPLFNVSGNGAFAMAVGYTSGYPVGAQVIKRLWEEKLLNTSEAERLMTFCNNSGPLFMLGVVAMGMFNNPKIGYIVMLSNYLGSFATGIIFRKHKFKEENRKNFNLSKGAKNKSNYINTNFGEILGTAVTTSMNTMIVIGGYIIAFSVLIEFLKVYGLINIIGKILAPVFEIIGFNKSLIPGYISGLMEITIGSSLISQATAPLFQKVILVSSILAWGGFSTHGQVIGVINSTKINYFPYFIAKIIHSIMAALFSYIFLKFMNIGETSVSEVFFQGNVKTMLNMFETSSYIFIALLLTIIFLIIILSLTKKEA
ncbi:sporulation integral membrane protein YlbJ [Thermoanaerobacterium sp. CMT5567-10]|uniref:sporulation integral membrane protein YlbJ n=1 Tax=Thermoanaerobacterium sp. CMT5567-10 TaxID=3061989 RepID=UPI0026E0693A|nr:sporulation integral membrane protein YlbJ [Thermoanaerobacterium sp. CMT5567-10]WKV09185.1 sporulation integral membrane protein YlbJ [Thermoanaerobacterium sp. CMT5567-10]WLY85440.1 sporulation integral membrane protein YlbJ [Thermoanaerobacterium sp. CMT5567-10]